MQVLAASVGAVLGAVLKPISDLLCSYVGSKTKTTFNLQSNIDAVEREMKSIMDRKKDVEHETETTKKEGNEIRAEVITWLEDVEKLQRRVNPILENKPSACFLNCSKRYRESSEVEEILEEIKIGCRYLEVQYLASASSGPSGSGMHLLRAANTEPSWSRTTMPIPTDLVTEKTAASVLILYHR